MELSERINEDFCKEVGIKPITCSVENKDTGEVKYYLNKSSLYKAPKNWINIEKHVYDKPQYPDLINNPDNFLKLLNIQWKLFGKLGNVYTKTGEECFELNYLKTRLNAVKLCKSIGGGDGLDVYIEEILNTRFEI